jgi:hypothetical protein
MTDIFPAYRPPDWAPLQRTLSAVFGVAAAEAAKSFWFIGYVEGPADVGELRLYEHSGTHRRLVLDEHGQAYRQEQRPGYYVRADNEALLIEVLV